MMSEKTGQNGSGKNGESKTTHANGNGTVSAQSGSAPDLEHIKTVVAASKLAQEHWRFVPFAERVALLKRAAKEMLRKRRDVMQLAHDEMGKVEGEAIFNEALGPLDAVSAWEKVIARNALPRKVRLNPINFAHKRARVDMLPRGVVGVIAPWNYPVAGLYRSLIPALMTGNGVVLKPSEYTPKTSGWLAEMLAKELPDGLIGVVHGDGRVGAALIDSGIDACVFTGSPRAGKIVRVQCAERGIPASVEMGGKDAAIVLADCDLQKTVAGITHWTLSNAGQACGAIEVAYVDHAIADAFVQKLARAWSELRAYDDIAPLANTRQFDIVTQHIEDARAKGAKIIAGPSASTSDGVARYVPPTICDHANDRMSVVRDETFGPMLAIVRVEGAGEAIRRVNQSRYGLGASIWSTDFARAERLAEKLDVGVVTVNSHGFSGAVPALPWSGTRETGFGVANGPESLATFVRPRAIIVDEAKGAELFYLPYDKALVELGELLADAQVGRIFSAWKIPLLMQKRISRLKKFFA